MSERIKPKYGHFEEGQADFTITDPQTPRAFDNFLWNDSVFSNIQQTGVGYCDYQVDGKEGVQLFLKNFVSVYWGCSSGAVGEHSRIVQTSLRRPGTISKKYAMTMGAQKCASGSRDCQERGAGD